MNIDLQNVFFKLLRMGLWGEGSFERLPVLSIKEWEIVWQYAQIHTVEGILFDSFTFLNESQLPPRELRLKWAVRVNQIEDHNKRMNEVIASQNALFDELGVKAILLKGQGVAACYLNPLRRLSGDIDWWFEDDGYDVLLNFLRQQNISMTHPLDSVGYEWKGIHCDHHRRLFDIFSPFNSSFLKKLQKNYRSAQQAVELEGQSVSILAPELQMLQVNVHILKHLLSFGVGLRQLCDAAVLYRVHQNQIDSSQIEMIYKRIGVLNWIHLLHGMLVEYLGLSKELIPFPYPSDQRVDWVMKEIWLSGNFGVHDKRYMGREGQTAPTRSVKGVRRLGRNLSIYFKYAPQEVLFFYIKRFKEGVNNSKKDLILSFITSRNI